jgi:polypeptide N-acetylgalactosaminyltransferase
MATQELSELQQHLDAIMAQTVPGLIRAYRRAEHTGIVGARLRGAKEAKFEIIVFLDSHCECLPGWLEPMVARIHEDRRRVIVPNIRGFHLDTLLVRQYITTVLLSRHPSLHHKARNFNTRASLAPTHRDLSI